jgi:hypothetical protein
MRNINNIISDRRVVIPEAYHITITMEDLFVESRQLLDPVRTNKSVVNVFTS